MILLHEQHIFSQTKYNWQTSYWITSEPKPWLYEYMPCPKHRTYPSRTKRTFERYEPIFSSLIYWPFLQSDRTSDMKCLKTMSRYIEWISCGDSGIWWARYLATPVYGDSDIWWLRYMLTPMFGDSGIWWLRYLVTPVYGDPDIWLLRICWPRYLVIPVYSDPDIWWLRYMLTPIFGDSGI